MSRHPWTAPAGTLRRGPLAVRVLGAEGPPVVLLHGLGGSNRYWGGNYDGLARTSRLVVPDLLGFGASPKPARGYTAEDHIAAIVATLDWLRIDAPVTVGAHSAGCVLALALAAGHPERVAGVLGVAPPLYPDAETALSHIAGLGWLDRQLAEGGPAAQRVCRFAHGHPATVAVIGRLARRRLPVPVITDGARHTWASYSLTFRNLILAAPGDQWLAEAARTPVRLLAGDADRIVDLAHLAHLAARHDHVSLATVAGGDHDLPLAEPERVLAELVALLE